MKRNLSVIRSYSPWLFLLLATVFLFLIVCTAVSRLEQKKEQAFYDFLENPDDYHEKLLLRTISPAHHQPLLALGKVLRENKSAYAALSTRLVDYEEYVEGWAHETKTPLSLLTLLLDNRGDNFPAPERLKLDYIRNRMQESVDQMLFYARLKGARADYLFEHLPLCSCIEEVLEDYGPLLAEKQFDVQCSVGDAVVYSDRRSLRFLLGQIVSNAVKYAGSAPTLRFEIHREDGLDILIIRDNGIGVRSCDLPYIFEKGFTGDSGEDRKKATGMGLYLVKGLAHDLNLTLDAASGWGKGFEMRVAFPVITREK